MVWDSLEAEEGKIASAAAVKVEERHRVKVEKVALRERGLAQAALLDK